MLNLYSHDIAKMLEGLQVKEFVECRIWEKGILKDIKVFEGNTVTDFGKQQIAYQVSGLGDNPINRIWCKVGSSTYSTTTTNSRSNNTLNVQTATPFTVAGVYSAVFSGSDFWGPSNYYNSIAVNITLEANSELEFIVKWVFSGFSETTGSYITASLMGDVSDNYNSPIGSFIVYLGGSPKTTIPLSKAIEAKTLTVSHTPAISGPNTFDTVKVVTSSTVGLEYRVYETFSGFTLTLDSSSKQCYFISQFVYG